MHCAECGKRKVLPPERTCSICRRRAVIIRSYKSTSSVRMAGAAAGCSQSYAWMVCEAAGLIRARTPSYSPVLVEEAVRLYVDERLSCRGVAATLKGRYTPTPSQQSIYQWLKARGLLRTKSVADVIQNSRRNGRDYEGEVGPRALNLATRKLSVRRIARELGVSRHAVSRHLSEEDRPGPREATVRETWLADTPEAEARRQKRSRVIDLRRQGAPYPEIEAETGLSKTTVYLYLRDAGLVASEDYPEELRDLVRRLASFRRTIRARQGELA